MAMTKKELAIYEGALRDAAIARALRWSDQEPLPPDIPAPAHDVKDSTGYRVRVVDLCARIEPIRSESHRHWHGHGEYSSRNGASQGGVALYSTKERAYRAARQLVELAAAKALLAIDEAIAKESP